MKVAVLGANGFLGKFITNQLTERGYTVYPISRKELDLTNFYSVTRWLEDVEPYAIVNCATAPNIGIDDYVYNDVQNNLSVFLNFYNNSHNFTKFFNVGSGAEFDRKKSIEVALEADILLSNPIDSYGYSKNIISRLSMTHEKFYTLRLFGCFHPTEPEFRLFNRAAKGEKVKIVDRQFDYFSARDFFTVLDYFLNNTTYHRDVNCVYEEKLYLSQVLNKINPVEVIGSTPIKYTGSGKKLSDLNLRLLGLDKSIEEYK
jgi:dTDP-4-dehydrorhamnose reductase